MQGLSSFRNPAESLSFDGTKPQTPNSTTTQSGGVTGGKSTPTTTSTPGLANHRCHVVECIDNDVTRDAQAPSAGDLLITEIYANPEGIDSHREWIELYALSHPFDLNGLRIISSSETGSVHEVKIQAESCLRVVPGEFAILHFGNPTDDLPQAFNIDVPTGTFLNNSAIAVEIYHGDELLDRAMTMAAKSGVSQSLRPDILDPASNDDPTVFCHARITGLFEGTGTPGQPNVCDPVCDDAGMYREPNRPAYKQLVITEIYSDPTGADDHRDWLEIYNAGGIAFDLNGLQITSQTTRSVRTWDVESSQCITVLPGDYAVISGINAAADGVDANATLRGGTSTLLFNDDAIVAVVANNEIIDSTATLDGAPGRSWALSPQKISALGNDEGSAWCLSTQPLNEFIDAGSPGLANETCP
ncbi:MAG: lamin tail domain-containing protein [Myxococcota bacterium]